MSFHSLLHFVQFKQWVRWSDSQLLWRVTATVISYSYLCCKLTLYAAKHSYTTSLSLIWLLLVLYYYMLWGTYLKCQYSYPLGYCFLFKPTHKKIDLVLFIATFTLVELIVVSMSKFSYYKQYSQFCINNVFFHSTKSETQFLRMLTKVLFHFGC